MSATYKAENVNRIISISRGDEFPTFRVRQLHVWLLSLQVPVSFWEGILATLSPDELDRARRFRFEHDRNRFVAGRGLLRHLLEKYRVGAAADLTFSYGPEGKPSLPDQDIEFNLSHSGDLAIFAFIRECLVGVDIEHHRPDFNLSELAQQNFSSFEQNALQSLPDAQKVEGFFNCWTRKEAFLKAVGGGLSVPLQLFDVSLAPGQPAVLCATRGHLPPIEDWSMIDVQVEKDVSAAVAVASKDFDLKLLTLAF